MQRFLAGRIMGFGVGIAPLAGISFFYRHLQVNQTTVALSFLLAILAVSAVWGMVVSVFMSVAAMLTFNYLFLPPVGTFTIADPQNWVALFAFLVTAVVASQLSTSVRKRGLEATRRHQEMERLYELSRGLMMVDKGSPIAGQVSHRTAQVFDLRGVAIFDRRNDF